MPEWAKMTLVWALLPLSMALLAWMGASCDRRHFLYVGQEGLMVRIQAHRGVVYFLDEKHMLCFATTNVGTVQIDAPGCRRLLSTYGEP